MLLTCCLLLVPATGLPFVSDWLGNLELSRKSTLNRGKLEKAGKGIAGLLPVATRVKLLASFLSSGAAWVIGISER